MRHPAISVESHLTRAETKPVLRPKPWLPTTAPPHILLTNVSLIDVEDERIYPGSSVSLRDSRIQSISRDPEEPLTVPQNTQTLDLEGYYLCPGLIDCHVHLTATPGSTLLTDMFAASPHALAYRTTHVARTMLLRGFTSARDTGGASAALRDSIAEGLLPGPRLFIAGKALSQTGGHGDARPTHEEDAPCCGGHTVALCRTCDGVPACLSAARDELRKGADFLKIMVGGGVASPSDQLDMLQFTAEEIRAITTTARQSHTYVTAHAYTREAIRHAVDNGVMGIEHGNLVDEETARYCAERGVHVTPTLITYEGMTKPPFDGFLNEKQQAKNKEVLDAGLAAMKTWKDAGVDLCYGSDLLSGLHALQNGEFRVRNRVMGAKEILKSATVYAARNLRMEGKLGVVKEGAIADLLILAKNPLDDIEILDRMESALLAIVKDGRVVASKLRRLAVDPLYDNMRI
ncbi:MAG: hypothetical protein M1818_002296 [Claussenomyces sp. TS43310]|nr:MAG: hypothetical protein M1818_002296 [Claussenomyces sp. TS43310]